MTKIYFDAQGIKRKTFITTYIQTITTSRIGIIIISNVNPSSSYVITSKYIGGYVLVLICVDDLKAYMLCSADAKWDY